VKHTITYSLVESKSQNVLQMRGKAYDGKAPLHMRYINFVVKQGIYKFFCKRKAKNCIHIEFYIAPDIGAETQVHTFTS
jgi:hypothetical protein